MVAPVSLLAALAQLPDPRKRRGTRHPLSAVLSLAVLAMLTGCKSYTAIVQFGRDHGAPLAHALGFRRGKTPAKSTFSTLFRILDIAAFEAILTAWIAARLPEADPLLVALDGKTARGSKDGEVPGQHLVAAYAPKVQAVLAQIRVDAKTNEHKAALELLGMLSVKGCIITGDAMFCQRDLCAKIIDKGGDYLFVVKDNQASLATDIAAGLGHLEQSRRTAAAFSPRRSAPAGARRANGQHHREGAWTAGEADAAADDGSDEVLAVGGAEAGLRTDTRTDRERENDGGSGARDHEPEPGTCRCSTVAGVDAGALGDRERAALPAGRDHAGRCEPNSQGRGATSHGSVTQHGRACVERSNGAESCQRPAADE